jgi:hypothetical protein
MKKELRVNRVLGRILAQEITGEALLRVRGGETSWCGTGGQDGAGRWLDINGCDCKEPLIM